MTSDTKTRYFLFKEGAVQEEPCEWEDLEALCRSGGLSPDSLIFMPEENDWKKAADTELAPLFEGVDESGGEGGETDPEEMAEAYRNVLKQVEEAGLPLTFHVAPRVGGFYGCVDELGLPRLERVLQACPNLVLLGHSQPFWAEIGDNVTEHNRSDYPKGPVKPGRLVQLMRDHPNLCGDLSAESGYNAISRDPEFGCQFLEEFQDRLYFGTDIANVPQELPIVCHFRDLQQEGRISESAYEKIAWRNAVALLGLEPAGTDSCEP